MVRMARSVRRRQPLGEWRRRASHRASQKAALPGLTLLYPGKFNNKTNGITPRRWLLACNPRLSADSPPRSAMAGRAISTSSAPWRTCMTRPAVPSRLHELSSRSTSSILPHHQEDCAVAVNPAALHDVQIKRFARIQAPALESACTFCAALSPSACYKNPKLEITPRVFVFHWPRRRSWLRHGQVHHQGDQRRQ